MSWKLLDNETKRKETDIISYILEVLGGQKQE